MTIYGRFHSKEFPNVVTVERMGTLEDVKKLDKRKPDKIDKKAVELGSYVVVKERDGRNAGNERLYHVGYLKADGGWAEISDAIEAATKKDETIAEQGRHDVAASVARHAGLETVVARFERGQVIKERTEFGVVLQSGERTYDVVWVGGSTSRYRHGDGDIRLATESELGEQARLVAHLRREAADARRERKAGARIKRGQIHPSR